MDRGYLERTQGDPLGEERIWYGVQNAVLAVANISKILWGPQAKDGTWPKEKERTPLRVFLGVSEPSDLKSKDMRNHLEHFDERIDKWFQWAQTQPGPPHRTDRTVASLPPSWAGKSRFRWIDANSLQVSFWDDTYELETIGNEVARISDILEDELSSPWFS